LRGCGALAFRDRRQQLHEGLVGGPGLPAEPRQLATEIGVGEGRRTIDRAGEEAFPERAERHEADAEFGKGRQDLGFGFTPPQGILALQCGDRLNGVGALDDRDSGLGKTEVGDLAGGDEFHDRAGYLLDRDFRVHAALVEQIDALHVQPAQRVLDVDRMCSGWLSSPVELLPSKEKLNVVAITTRLRTRAKAFPTSSSLLNGP